MLSKTVEGIRKILDNLSIENVEGLVPAVKTLQQEDDRVTDTFLEGYAGGLQKSVEAEDVNRTEFFKSKFQAELAKVL